MGKITALKNNKANTRTKLYIDDELISEINIDTVFIWHLELGKELDDDTLSAMLTESNSKLAFEYLIDYLSKYPSSERKAKLKLKDKGYNYEDIESAIAKAKEYNYINDSELSERLVEDNSARMSKRQLKEKLFKCGIPSNIISNVLANVSENDERDTAFKTALAWGRYKDYDDKAFKEKYTRYMSTKGFSWDIINKVYSILMKELKDGE